MRSPIRWTVTRCIAVLAAFNQLASGYDLDPSSESMSIDGNGDDELMLTVFAKLPSRRSRALWLRT